MCATTQHKVIVRFVSFMNSVASCRFNSSAIDAKMRDPGAGPPQVCLNDVMISGPGFFPSWLMQGLKMGYKLSVKVSLNV